MEALPNVVVDLMVMKTSCGADYFCRFKANGNTCTPHMSRHRYQMEYHVAYYNWFFNGGEEPRLMSFTEESHPNLYPNTHPADQMK